MFFQGVPYKFLVIFKKFCTEKLDAENSRRLVDGFFVKFTRGSRKFLKVSS